MAGEIPHWNDESSQGEWQTLKLGGELIPGVPEVECEVSWDVDKQKPKKAEGYTTKDNGLEPSKVDITIRLYTIADLQRMAQLMPLLRPKKGAARSPLDIDYPSTNVLGIGAIIIEKIKAPMPTARDGWHVRISAVEYFAKPKPNQGLGGKKGEGGESCAATAAQAQAATSERMAIQAAADDVAASGDEESLAPILAQLKNAKGREQALYSALKKCKGGGASPPPGPEANDNVFGTDEEALLKQQAA